MGVQQQTATPSALSFALPNHSNHLCIRHSTIPERVCVYYCSAWVFNSSPASVSPPICDRPTQHNAALSPARLDFRVCAPAQAEEERTRKREGDIKTAVAEAQAHRRTCAGLCTAAHD